jgi:hypothetical protein
MQRFFAILVLLVLGACAPAQLGDSRPQNANDPLLRPPWEAMVKAGPGAEKEVDLETLNGAPKAVEETQPVFEPVQEVPEPKSKPKPSDTIIKAVAVLPVVGAKGKGNAELTAAMRKVLKDAGWPVLSARRADALVIQGRVVMDAAQGGQQPVHIGWFVITPKGKALGDVKQNNAVPAGSLDQGFGENAGFVAQAAADGIFKLIEKYR